MTQISTGNRQYLRPPSWPWSILFLLPEALPLLPASFLLVFAAWLCTQEPEMVAWSCCNKRKIMEYICMCTHHTFTHKYIYNIYIMFDPDKLSDSRIKKKKKNFSYWLFSPINDRKKYLKFKNDPRIETNISCSAPDFLLFPFFPQEITCSHCVFDHLFELL